MATLERLTTRISIEMTGDTRRYLVSAKQGDKATRYIVAKLLNNGTPYVIPAGARVAFNVEKPDRKYVYNTCTYSGSEVTVELTNQTLAVAGTAYCDIEVRTGDNTQLITSASFTIEIEKSMRNDKAILSSNEFTELEDRIAGHIQNITGTDSAVKKAEEARKKAEQERNAAEDERKTAEGERNTAENERKAAEQVRKQNENTRIIQEKKRQEDVRQALENTEGAVERAEKATQECVEAIQMAQEYESQAENYSKEAESWAHGGTGTRDGEDTDNSEFYSRQSKNSSDMAMQYLGKVEQAGEEAVNKIKDALDMDAPDFQYDFETGILYYSGGRFVFGMNNGILEWGLAV